MLTGRNPFGAGNVDATTLLYRIVHENPAELPEVTSEGLSADIRPAILASLNKNPGDRPQDAATFKAMLHGAPAPAPGTRPAPSAQTTSFSGQAAQGKKWLPYALVGGIGVIIIIAIFLFATSGGSGGGVIQGDTPLVAPVDPASTPDPAAGEAEPAEEEVIEEEPPKKTLTKEDIASAQASASTVLEREYDEYDRPYDYYPEFTLDGDYTSAWFEGVEGNGINEWLRIDFASEVPLTGINIRNGYWISEDRVTKNNRIKFLRIDFSDGSSEEFSLDDPALENYSSLIRGNGQEIVFAEVHDTRYVKITILDVYPGSKWQDTGISDVSFF
jgi:hypothetical protein